MSMWVKLWLRAAVVTPASSVAIPASSSFFGGYLTVMSPMIRLPMMARMLNAVFSWPSWVMGVSSAVLISGISRLRATSWGPVDAVERASAIVMVLVSV